MVLPSADTCHIGRCLQVHEAPQFAAVQPNSGDLAWMPNVTFGLNLVLNQA